MEVIPVGINTIKNITEYGQIASGKRIQHAADDAAGLAIAKKLNVTARGTDVATRNTREGIHVSNIADGGYNSIMERLQRVRELSVQAMNGLYSDSDRQIIQDEINQQLQGISEASRNTVYNEQKLLDGSKTSIELATTPTGKRHSMQLYNATLENLGLDGYSVVNGDINLDAIDAAIEQVSRDRSKLGASANALAARERINQVAYENLVASQSRIEDLEMNEGIVKLKTQETLQSVQLAMQNKKKEQDQMILGIF